MPEPIGRDRLLIVVSAAQLATGVAGMAIGLRRRHPYDVFWMHGDADTIGRDAIFKGTALSAPVSNMVIQAGMTGVMARWPSRLAAQALAAGGLCWSPAIWASGWYGNACGHRGWDPVESPLLMASIGLAAAMAGLSRRVGKRR